MPGYTTYASLKSTFFDSCQRVRIPFYRISGNGSAGVAARWAEFGLGGGTGGVLPLATGTAGQGIVFNSSTVGAIPIPQTGNKYLMGMNLMCTAATMVPGFALLTDVIHIYPNIVTTSTTETVINSGGGVHPTWTGTGDTRMTNAYGVQLSLLQIAAAQTVGSAQITITGTGAGTGYTNQAGSDNKSQIGSFWSPTATTNQNCFWCQASVGIPTMGGLNMAFGAGDYGIQNVKDYVVGAAATGGAGTFILHRPVAMFGIPAVSTFVERDFTLQGVPPRIYDDACLTFFYLHNGNLVASSALYGELDIGFN